MQFISPRIHINMRDIRDDNIPTPFIGHRGRPTWCGIIIKTPESVF